MGAAIWADKARLERLTTGGEVPTLVDFTASWCGPCKSLSAVLEAFAQERGESISVLKVDIDQEQDLAAVYSVRAVPTLMLFAQGTRIAARTGAMTGFELKRFVDAALAQQETAEAKT